MLGKKGITNQKIAFFVSQETQKVRKYVYEKIASRYSRDLRQQILIKKTS